LFAIFLYSLCSIVLLSQIWKYELCLGYSVPKRSVPVHYIPHNTHSTRLTVPARKPIYWHFSL